MKKPTARTTLQRHLHTEMALWAASKDRKVLSVSVVFHDGSVYTDTFSRAKIPVEYKVDGEVYTVDIDAPTFISRWLPGCESPVTAKALKQAFVSWLDTPYKSIKWCFEKA